MLWFEDAKVIDRSIFERHYRHFYNRPCNMYNVFILRILILSLFVTSDRYNVMSYIGAAAGVILMIAGAVLYTVEYIRRDAFQRRIFVD